LRQTREKSVSPCKLVSLFDGFRVKPGMTDSGVLDRFRVKACAELDSVPGMTAVSALDRFRSKSRM